MAKTDLMDYDQALELFEPVIGLEVHVELNTTTKMFSGGRRTRRTRRSTTPRRTRS